MLAINKDDVVYNGFRSYFLANMQSWCPDYAIKSKSKSLVLLTYNNELVLP